MLELIIGVLCWIAFKNAPETKHKRRRYHLATNFARK